MEARPHSSEMPHGGKDDHELVKWGGELAINAVLPQNATEKVKTDLIYRSTNFLRTKH